MNPTLTISLILVTSNVNTLSSSPLAFCRVQKPGHFWHIFRRDPNGSSRCECYNTYANIQTRDALTCGVRRKLG